MHTPKIMNHFLFAVALVAATVGARAAHAAAGEVRELRGEATLADATSTQKLQVGMAVRAGQRIVTGHNARVLLAFADGTNVTLGADTEFAVKDYRYAPQSRESKAAFELLRGVFRAITGKLGDQNPPDFTVTTAVAVLGIRGTDFWGGFLFSNALDVAVFAGKGVYVQNSAGRVDIVAPGYGTTVRSATTAPEPPKRWGSTKLDAARRAVSFDREVAPHVDTDTGDWPY
jgi:hypothetical protein